ncbi:hypothetical protein, partial [Vibrio cortegadensis]
MVIEKIKTKKYPPKGEFLMFIWDLCFHSIRKSDINCIHSLDKKMERYIGFEPMTSTLARLRS